MTTPIRTSAADVNWLSCSANIWGLNEGSDHAQALDKQPDPIDLMPEGPAGYASILKICDGTHDIVLPAPGQGLLKIAQGVENSLDINNRVSSVSVYAEFSVSGAVGDQVITVKGGSHDIKIAGIVHSTGRNGEVVVGAWSDQCFDESSYLDFTELVHADGEPLTFVLARCHDVKLPPGARVLRWKSLSYNIYWYLKRAYVAILQVCGWL